ncbi:MAG: amidohydrolase family protein [Cytophagales bacterium]|nr:amidohydrolase family protein [Cytophagales bacterium]
MANKLLIFSIIQVFSHILLCQNTIPANSISDDRPAKYALVGATVYIDYQNYMTDATILINKSKIEAVGKNLPIPNQYTIISIARLFIYPSFIDLHSSYGLETAKTIPPTSSPYAPNTKGAYGANDAIKSYQNAYANYKNDASAAETYRASGFGIVLTHHHDGIARGTGALAALSEKKENENLLIEKASKHFSFDKGTSAQYYPGSLMGSIALLRQTLSDVLWYENNTSKPQKIIPLQALTDTKNLTSFFETNDKSNVLRAAKIAKEWNYKFIIKGGGNEYQKINEIKQAGISLIEPVVFPQGFDTDDPIDASLITYYQLKHWEQAPFNLYYLWKENIPFAITSHGLKDKNQLLPNLRKCIKAGLPAAEALKALTYTPAAWLNVQNMAGAIKPGYLANFIVCSDSLFSPDNKIYENWVLGEKYTVQAMPLKDIRGNYQLNIIIDTTANILPTAFNLNIKGKINALELELQNDTAKAKATCTYGNDFVQIQFTWKNQPIKLSGWITNNTWSGLGEDEKNNMFKWQATLDMAFKNVEITDSARLANIKTKQKEDSIYKVVTPLIYPFMSYGTRALPKPRKVLFKNATVWTNENEGNLKNTDVLVENGKIITIGKITGIKPDTTIDCTGKHLTAGIIDEHSHIAIRGGVNECTNSITAEVRVGDVINNEDVNIYRNLAGGVTMAQLLHGSCNAAGGQSAVIKLRWGQSAENMKYDKASPFIKFALGENVKQSNWGDSYTERYPQTRMGVEQIYIDAFTRALEYEKMMKNAASAKPPVAFPRRDLQMETLLEIINKTRFITCHSYVQSEIVMLMRVAEQFGFKVNTFTHILEGYKVADKMKAHGAGASTFADWWAYKNEVKDAIPYNAAILHKVGVVTAINSDDAEMSRRLNQEAAKAVKYGGVSELEAWKMVTLNPAKLLHLDTYTGSIKPGKDADIVLWDNNPLSIYAKVLQTYVDGVLMYDVNDDKLRQKIMQDDRIAIMKKMKKSKKDGESVQKPAYSPQKTYHCEDKEIDYLYYE